MAWAYHAASFAQSGSLTYAAAGNTLALGASSSGDVAIVFAMAFNSATPAVPTVTDNQSNAYTHVGTDATWVDSGFNFRVSCFTTTLGATTPTIKVVSGSGSDRGGFAVGAYSGIAGTVDKDAVASGSTSPASATTAATTAANELVIGFYADGGWGATLAAGTGMTLRGKHDADGTSFECLWEDKDSGASGSTEASSVTFTGANWGYTTKVFTLAAGGGGSPVEISHLLMLGCT